MRAITTFPGDMWDVYAHEFLRTFVEFWPIPLTVYWQDGPYGFHGHRIAWAELSEVPYYTKFMESPRRTEEAAKWAPKAFAQLSAFNHYRDEQILWLDADIVTRSAVPERILNRLFSGKAISYLGRKGAYPDCSMVAFDTKESTFSDFEKRYRAMYEKEEIYDLKRQTDANALQAILSPHNSKNLTPNVTGYKDAFEFGLLGSYCEHKKGKRKYLSNASGCRV